MKERMKETSEIKFLGAIAGLLAMAVIAGVILLKDFSPQPSLKPVLKERAAGKRPVLRFERVEEIPEGVRLSEWQEDYDRETVVGVPSGAAVELCDDLKESIEKADLERIAALSRKLAELGDEAVPALRGLIDCGRREIELEGLRILSLIETRKSIAAALDKLVSNSDNEQFLKQLSNLRTPAVAQLLVQLMGETDQPELLNSIRNIMAAMEGTEVVDALAVGIENPTDRYHLQDCAAILGELSKPSNIPGLVHLLETSANSISRSASALALGNIGNADACNALALHAKNSKDDAEICLTSLSGVASPYGQQFLLTMLRDDNMAEPVRIASAQALGNFNSTYVRDQLMETSESGVPEAVSAVIEESVENIGEVLDNNVAHEVDVNANEFIERE
jgi:HEAT repeat protein